jgi:hypothetical protein
MPKQKPVHEPQILDELPPDPLRNGSGRPLNPAIVLARANPGKWVSYAIKNHPQGSSYTSNLRRGDLKSAPPNEFDFEWRGNDDGKTNTIYIRYHGGAS